MSHSHNHQVHVALLPSVGMGHLTPFLRLASLLLRRRRCRVSLITMHPTISISESLLISRFLSSFPSHQLSHLQLDLSLSPPDPSSSPADPFWLRFDAVRRSMHLLLPLLRSASPLSALVFDVSLIAPVLPIVDSLSLPRYILFTASARMLSFVSRSPSLLLSDVDDVTTLPIPGLSPGIPKSSVPPMLLKPNSIFANILKNDMPKLASLNGVLINTFEALEPEAQAALNAGEVAADFPPVHPLGPLEPCGFEKSPTLETVSKWLDEQPDESVVYVSFGSRTALPREQMREIGEGLAKSGCRFLWVVKEKQVDREETEGNLEELIMGRELWERMKENGLVVKHWVDQAEILAHRAVGGFVSHCGWNSVTEAALYGVRMLAWPQNGDQKISAEVVRACGLGIWVEAWGWMGGGDVGDYVKAEEIAERVREMMGSGELRSKAAEIGEAGRRVAGGGREEVVERLVQEWKKNVRSTV